MYKPWYGPWYQNGTTFVATSFYFSLPLLQTILFLLQTFLSLRFSFLSPEQQVETSLSKLGFQRLSSELTFSLSSTSHSFSAFPPFLFMNRFQSILSSNSWKFPWTQYHSLFISTHSKGEVRSENDKARQFHSLDPPRSTFHTHTLSLIYLSLSFLVIFGLLFLSVSALDQ